MNADHAKDASMAFGPGPVKNPNKFYKPVSNSLGIGTVNNTTGTVTFKNYLMRTMTVVKNLVPR